MSGRGAERRRFPGGVVGYRAPSGLGLLDVWIYRVGRTLIDSGGPRQIGRLLPLILADGPVERVLLTHHHEDHAGGAEAIRRATDATVVTHRWTAPLLRARRRSRFYQWVLFGGTRRLRVDAVLDLPARGRLVWETPDGRFELIHAPGHSHDMAVVAWPARRILFSADLFLGRRLRGMRADESWPELEASLARVLETVAFDHLLCTHNPVTETGRAALAEKLEWMRHTSRRLAELRAEADDPVPRRARIAELLGPERRFMKLFTLGDVSRERLMASAAGQPRPRRDVLGPAGPPAAYRFEEPADDGA